MCITTLFFFFLFVSTIHSQTNDDNFNTTTINDSNTYKIGVVQDKFLKYVPQDLEIYNGCAYFADWVNRQGGLRYLIKDFYYYLKNRI